MSDEYKIVSIYDDDPSKSLPNVGVVDMDSRLPIHKGDDDYNATVQQLADAIHKPEIVEGSMTTDIIRKNTIFFLKNNETTINLTLSAAKITVLEGTDIVESSDKAAGFIVIAVNGSTKVHNVIYGTTSWELPSEKAMGFVWSGSTWTVASIDVESIVSAVGEFTQLTVSNLTVTEVIEGEAVDNAINAKLAMYTPLETVIPLYRVFDANAAVGVLQLPRILDKTWSVPRGSANLPPQESDYRIEFKSRYLVGGSSQSIQIAYATDEENPNVYCRGCKYDAETERWSFGDWKEIVTNTQLATTLDNYPTKTEVENRLNNYQKFTQYDFDVKSNSRFKLAKIGITNKGHVNLKVYISSRVGNVMANDGEYSIQIGYLPEMNKITGINSSNPTVFPKANFTIEKESNANYYLVFNCTASDTSPIAGNIKIEEVSKAYATVTISEEMTLLTETTTKIVNSNNKSVITETDLLNIPITYKTNADDCIPTESGKKSTFCVLAGGGNLPTTSGTGHYIIESVRAKTTGGAEFVMQNAINFDNNTMYIRRAVYNGSFWNFNAWK